MTDDSSSTNASRNGSVIAVLGLGRMGSALARRFHECGHTVAAWSRSGRTSPHATSFPTVAAAARDADVVTLAVYDYGACLEALAALGEARPRIVVNTSTVGPAEGGELARCARAIGARYVHAPIIGSVPAVAGARPRSSLAATPTR